MSELTRSKLRIMLVENDEDDAFFVRRALTQAGYIQPFIRQHNGKEAVEYFQKAVNSTSIILPHIVLMDVKMPVMDGFGVLRWLREESPFKDLPVIMLTSSNAPSDLNTSQRLGIFQFITKRVHYDNVIEALDLFLASAKGKTS